jgi:hypothetical protein
MKPCPFCGGGDLRWGKSEFGMRYHCMSCRASGPPVLTEIRGKDAQETMRLREREASRLWEHRQSEGGDST